MQGINFPSTAGPAVGPESPPPTPAEGPAASAAWIPALWLRGDWTLPFLLALAGSAAGER